MTPAARVAAAIEILDQIFDGVAGEKALTNWARSSRYAGSKDRAAIRDHVFDALRCKRSFAALGGNDDGRGTMIGALRSNGIDPKEIFTGTAYSPSALTDDEAEMPTSAQTQAEQLDCPDWMLPEFEASLGDDAEAVLRTLQQRAPVSLRVNTRKADIATAREELARDGVETVLHAEIKTALQVSKNPRRVANSEAFKDGLVELQDAASQAAILRLPVQEGTTVLDYCAGGGGKALGLAALGAQVTAHDIDEKRMSDISPRAERAGVSIKIAGPDDLPTDATFDVVLCDAPCSGSGTWRRAPEAKWALTTERLEQFVQTQSEVLLSAEPHVASGGTLAYATCSIFDQENRETVDTFLASNEDFSLVDEMKLRPNAEQDGFYLAVMTRV